MNRYARDVDFDVAFGTWIHWALRAEFGAAEPASESLCRIQERIAALERTRAERASRFWLLRSLLVHACHLLDDSVFSSEAVWATATNRSYILAHERPTSPWAAPWPAFGQMMPLW